MNDEGRLHSAPATSRTDSETQGTPQVARLVSLDDFWSIPCDCPADKAEACGREGRCQVPRVSLDDFNDVPTDLP